MNFLQEETFPSSKELLVMHYLQKGRYVEGIRLNELMKKDKMVLPALHIVLLSLDKVSGVFCFSWPIKIREL